MRTQQLNDVLVRVDEWPAEAQDELAAFAAELDAGINEGLYLARSEELAGIDRGLASAAKGAFASDEAVEATFATFLRR